MPRKIKLLLLLCAFLLTMCRNYDQSGPIASTNGLSCQNYTDYGVFSRQQGAECFYACPDGSMRQPVFSERYSENSQLFSASKADLDAHFCSMDSQPTSTISPGSTSLPLIELTPSPTLIPTIPTIPTVLDSPTAEIPPTVQSSPLLTGSITMCDQKVGLISFRIAQPAPDLTGKVITAQISEQQTSCAVNPVNTSLLTCPLPKTVISFPSRIVVSVDSIVVNDFTYDGTGCNLIDTPFPSLTPTP